MILAAVEPVVVHVKLTDDQVTFLAVGGTIVLFALFALVFSQFRKP